MTPKDLLKSSAFMMSMALIIALLTNVAGVFPSQTLTTDVRSNLTVLLLAVMMTLSLSRYTFSNLSPVAHWKSVLRAIVMGLIVASLIPLAGYYLLKDTEFGQYYSVFSELPEDTVVCMAVRSFVSSIQNNKQDEQRYNNHVALFRKILEFDV